MPADVRHRARSNSIKIGLVVFTFSSSSIAWCGSTEDEGGREASEDRVHFGRHASFH